MKRNTLWGWLIAIAVAAFASATLAQTPVEISFYYPVAVGGPITKLIDNFASDFEKENPGIKVKPIYSGSYQESITKALTAVKSNDAPTMSVLLSTDMFTLIDEEAIVPFDPLIRTPEDQAWLKGFYPAFMENSQTGGKTWGIPFQRSTIVLYYNKEMFKDAGLEVALEATTGWRFVVEELERIGADAHLAEVVQTAGLKGRGKRPKTDWADARHLRELLLIGRLPESWIAPAHLLDLRARVRCRHTLLHQRTEWQQRMQAVLYHHGAPQSRGLLKLANRERVAALKLPAAAREQLTIALQLIDAIDLQLAPFDLSLRAYARKQPGCRTLKDQIYGIGELTSVTILAELGDTRRFQNSRDAVRYGGLDITIRESDQRRAPGHLSRQGPPALRWALYEAAQAARRPSSPDRAYYEQLAARIGGNRACIAISRKLLKRSYHLLRALGDQALEPVTT